jgi:hypothetical protein
VPGVDVEVDPVLDGLRLGHPLEQHARPEPGGVDDRGVLLLPRTVAAAHEVSGPRRLQHVAEGHRPERREPAGVTRVHSDLEGDRHGCILP